MRRYGYMASKEHCCVYRMFVSHGHRSDAPLCARSWRGCSAHAGIWCGTVWFWPLLGILFLPYTTVMYMLAWTAGTGIVGWDWMWVGMGLVLDLIKWAQLASTRSAGARLSGVSLRKVSRQPGRRARMIGVATIW